MGVKRTKNKPVLHAEVKKQHGIFLTDSVWLKLKDLAREQNTSVSELIERWGQSLL